jgi:hypothetical protein
LETGGKVAVSGCGWRAVLDERREAMMWREAEAHTNEREEEDKGGQGTHQ